MRILVFGATGGAGRAIVARLMKAGHAVTASVRDPSRLDLAPRPSVVTGDAMNAQDVAGAVPGHDAIVVSLGDRPEPLEWLPGKRRTRPAQVCETGTRNIVAALDPETPPRIVVVSAYGVGDTRDTAPWVIRVYLRLAMAELMADKARQEALLKATDLDVVLVQPVALTDGPATGAWFASAEGGIRKQQVSRGDLAAFIAGEIDTPRHSRATVALSG